MNTIDLNEHNRQINDKNLKIKYLEGALERSKESNRKIRREYLTYLSRVHDQSWWSKLLNRKP